MPILRTVLIAGALGVTLLLQAQPGLVSPRFVDVAASAGVSFEHRSGRTSQKFLIETMGSGVALFDYDGDGLLDIYLVNGAALDAPMPAGAEPDKPDPAYWNRLYRNLGDWRFKDVTEAAGAAGRGYGMGAAVGDYDNDGDPDLYVTNFGRNMLLQNDGAGSFTDVTADAGVGGRGWSSGAAFVDYDRDGRLDLFMARYLDWDFSKNIPCGNGLPDRRSYCHPRSFAPIEHLLFRNIGQGKFEDVSHTTGISAYPGKGLGVAVGDYDRDGWVDIFVANDAYPQQLFRNFDGKRFEEVGVAAGVAYDADGRDFAGMGVAIADYDNDGQTDIFVNALARQSYWLFRNRGGEFRSASRSSGLGPLTDLHSGWGSGPRRLRQRWLAGPVRCSRSRHDDIEWSDPALAYREPFLLLKTCSGGSSIYRRTPALRSAKRPRAAAPRLATSTTMDEWTSSSTPTTSGRWC